MEFHLNLLIKTFYIFLKRFLKIYITERERERASMSMGEGRGRGRNRLPAEWGVPPVRLDPRTPDHDQSRRQALN